jgi:CHAT domain-containing protein
MTYLMPTPDDVTGYPFMVFNGNLLLPGIIVHSAEAWTLHPPAAASLNLFALAAGAGLNQVHDLSPAAVTEMFRNPSPGWRAIGDPDRGRLRIRDGRGRFEIRELAIADPPEGWWDTADIAQRLLLYVTDQPLESADGRELARIARYGGLCAAAIEFGATDVPVPPLPGDDTLRMLVDPAGAVIALADNVEARIITMAEARSRLRSLSELLSTEQVAAKLSEEELVQLLLGIATGPGEHLGLGYVAARLVTEFAEIRDPSRTSRMWREGADRTVAAGIRALAAGRDPAIFIDAAELAGVRLAQLRESAGPGGKRELAQALAAAVRLRLAARGPEYAGGDDYALTDGLLNCVSAGVDCAAGTGQADLPPDPGRCLNQAWELLDKLLLLEPGDEQIRALALSCLLQYELRRAAAEGRDFGALTTVIEQLSALTVADADPVLAMFLARLRCQSDPARGPAPIAQVLARPAEEFRARYGDLIARQVRSQAILAARETRSRPLLIEALAWSDGLPPPAAGADLRQVLEARLHCLAEDPTLCPEPVADLRELAEGYRTGHPEWTGAQRAAALLHLAAHARAESSPALGVALFREVDDRFKSTSEGLLLSADLYLQLALAGAEEPIGRSGAAAMAAAAYAGLGLLELAGACLLELRQWLSERDQTERWGAILGVAAALPQLRSSRDPVLSGLAHDVAHRAVLAAVADGESLTMQLALHRAAKGADFAAARIEHQAFTPPPQIDQLRSQWEFLSAVRTAADLDRLGSESGDMRLLDVLPYLDYGESTAGSDLTQIEENQRRHLDHLITKDLLDSRYSVEFQVEREAELQNRLDDRTVLLTYFIPDRRAGNRDFFVLLAITREDVNAWVIISDRTPVATGAGRSRRHVLSDEVHEVLKAVIRPPGPGVVRPSAAELFDRPDRIFGDPGALSRWRAQGKDHLLIWPHGPLHYLPFHLYTVDGEPVAARWTVTTIPGLESLPGRRAARARRRRRTVVVGYAHPDHSTPEVCEQLRKHAHEVAALTGAAALTDREATRSRLMAELRDADVIHLAVHGFHDPAAPWFDFLRLHPDTEDDGRVFACDMLAADLRGVRLVTLAACDSALGRFDLNDNLRGVLAGILLAGAQAVVGCLWPVQPAPATMFFGSLHRALAEGAAPLAAFRSAQVAARQEFPHYRDWGAFSYVEGGRA